MGEPDLTSNGSESGVTLGVTLGEPAGVGPEIILKAWLQREKSVLPSFIVLGGADHLQDLAQRLGLNVPIVETAPQDAARIFKSALPVMPLAGEIGVHGQPARPSEVDAKLVSGSIIHGVQSCFDGELAGIVTAPINKKALYDAGFSFPGHTEFLAELAAGHTGRSDRPVMLLAGPDLKTVPVTIHIPLEKVPVVLTTDLIVDTARIVASEMKKRFGLKNPRLAISGLNPHAGEGGTMGKEDEAIILPAIVRLQADGIDAVGPLPADTMFHQRARKTYDVALCMYHDQALIPAKTLAFDDAVNVTLGLPFIRTSPDHGTAFDIAGKGVANPSSMIAAIQLAGNMARHAGESASSQVDAGAKA